MSEDENPFSSVELAAELTIAWLSNPNNKAEVGDVTVVLEKMHTAVKSLANPPAPEAAATEQFVPAVSVRKSLASKDHIISLIDGKPYKSLKRHLGAHGLTPESYRERYGLKPGYPMVSEAYAKVRSDMAKKLGLGRKPKASPAKPKAAPAKSKARLATRGRPKKTV